jgi:predicted molibdopterin-dependent oxidoreductase YjgC
MVRLTIDGREIDAEEGTTVLRAAEAYGIEIPHLCYDERLEPIASCRLCLVEVDGTIAASCAYPVREGIKVITSNKKLMKMRRTAIELMLSDHSAECIMCERSGNCLLEKYAYEFNVKPPYGGKKGTRKPIKNELFSFDRDKCILCGKCVSVCKEIQQCNVLEFAYRGIETCVSTPFNRDFKESNCVFCGNCLSVCPTGAMVENEREGKGREWELKETKTVCPYCGVGCSITLHVKDNRIVKVSSPADSLHGGWLCVKGRFGFDFVNSEERLKAPLIRKDGVLKEAGWDEALDYVASKLLEIKKRYGSSAIGGFSSAKCTNEENYLFQKFMRCAVGTNNVDHCARLCHAPTVVGLAKAFGSGAMTNTIKELENADCIFIIGSNATETQPVTALSIKSAKSRGAKLIVADPRKTELIELADLHIQLNPGSDIALINAMMAVILERGWENGKFVAQCTEGFDTLRDNLRTLDLEEAERITGVDKKDIELAAELYAKSERSSIVYCMGITQHTCGTQNVLALADLAMLCGKVGKESCGVNPLRGQCNVQGACDMGALPEFFTGYQKTADEKAVEKFEKAWGVKLSRKKGLTLEEMLHDAEEGRIKALCIMGENPVLSGPNSKRIQRALEKLELLVVQDLFLTETAELAEVVLPASCFAEKDGTFTNTERTSKGLEEEKWERKSLKKRWKKP